MPLWRSIIPHLSDADIQARVADLIEKKVPENNTEEVKKFLFNVH